MSLYEDDILSTYPDIAIFFASLTVLYVGVHRTTFTCPNLYRKGPSFEVTRTKETLKAKVTYRLYIQLPSECAVSCNCLWLLGRLSPEPVLGCHSSRRVAFPSKISLYTYVQTLCHGKQKRSRGSCYMYNPYSVKGKLKIAEKFASNELLDSWKIVSIPRETTPSYTECAKFRC